MLTFGVRIKWEDTCFSGCNTTVLRRTWDLPPTDEQLQEAVESWVLSMIRADDEELLIAPLHRIRRVDVIEFDLELSDVEVMLSRLNELTKGDRVVIAPGGSIETECTK